MMIRTQIYITKQVHEKLHRVADSQKKSMAQIIREFIEVSIEKYPQDEAGISTLTSIAKLGISGGPQDLSQHLDDYLYGQKK